MEFHAGGRSTPIACVFVVVVAAASLLPLKVGAADVAGHEHPEYQAIKQRLASGWNTWNTRSVLSHTLLPEGFGINLAFKQVRWLDEPYLREVLFGRDVGDAHIRPGPHTLDGSYTRLDIQWQQLWARVESAHAGDDLVVLVTSATLARCSLLKYTSPVASRWRPTVSVPSPSKSPMNGLSPGFPNE